MRLAIFSDTHGNTRSMRQALTELGPFEAIMHAGDGVLDGLGVAQEWGLPFHGVAGNEDWGTGLPESCLVTLGQWRLFLIHGHQTEINPYQPRDYWQANLNELMELATSNQAQVLVFGHTHVPMVEKCGPIMVCNPGTHHLGASQPHSMVICIFDHGSVRFQIMETVDQQRWSMVEERRLEW